MAYKLRTTDSDALICEGAKVTGDVTLCKGVSVWYNAVLRGDDGPISVGENTNIQDCVVMHEGTTVGAGCTIGPKISRTFLMNRNWIISNAFPPSIEKSITQLLKTMNYEILGQMVVSGGYHPL